MFTKVKNGFHKFPIAFWILIFSTFIDQVGGAMLFPFFSLYITDHFQVGLTEVGFIFSLFSVGMIGGNIIGGALADKMGRRLILIFGIVVSGLSSLIMAFINQIEYFYILALLIGIVGSVGQPAQQAMVTDLLPQELQADGFGIFRVAMNLSVAIGPFLGSVFLALAENNILTGLIRENPYILLFIGDAVASTITAFIVLFTIPETKPERAQHEKEESFIQSFKGYFTVFKDGIFITFVVLSAIVSLVYMQMNSSLSVFLRDEHGFGAKQFGYLLSMNAFMVVFLQFPITRLLAKRSPIKTIAFGTFLYAIGFGMYGFISTPFYFFLAMIIITIGEMIISPFSQTIVARFASEDMRGRYMAIYGFSWTMPSIFGVIVAGLIIDNHNPNLVWIFGGILLLIAAGGYLLIRQVSSARLNGEPKVPESNQTDIHLEPAEN